MELVTLATATAAAGFLAGGASRLAIAGWRRAAAQLQQSRFQSQVRNELRRQTTRARLAGQAHGQSTGSTSPWRVMEVVEVVDESLDVRSFYLQNPLHESPLPDYQAGQFVIVRPALGGADMPCRCYSLSDAPGQNWYRISVKRQQTSPRARQGLSSWLHEHIHIGDCLLVSGPHGDFTVEDSVPTDAPIVLLAAGVGVTPLLSMLKSLLHKDQNRHVAILAQVQDSEHWPFGELFHSWAKQCPNLKAATYFSRLTQDQLPAVENGSVHVGKFDSTAVWQSVPQPTQAHYYMCGPEEWMIGLENALAALGVPQEHIHWESFATKSNGETSDEDITDWDIKFLRSGIATPASNQSISVLQAASEQGLSLPAACHSGACGTCKLKLVKGSVKYASRPACSRRADEIVACVAQAVGSIEVDA